MSEVLEIEARLRQGAPARHQHRPEGYRRGPSEKVKRQRVKWVVKDGLLQLDTISHMSSSPAPKTLGGKGTMFFSALCLPGRQAWYLQASTREST